MWKLDEITSKEMEIFSNGMLDHVKERMANLLTYKYPFKRKGERKKTREKRLSGYITVLSEDKLKELFSSKPIELEVVNSQLMEAIVPGYTLEYDDYLSLKANSKRNTLEKKKYTSLRAKYEIVLKELQWLMDYDGLCSNQSQFLYDICQMKDASVCPYCNRQYTFTIFDKAGNQVVRPHLDHWHPKSLFPLMSLSFYNLIPSCPSCNSSIKGSIPFRLSTHIHPYLQKKCDPGFSFHAIQNGLGGWRAEIWSHGNADVTNTIAALKLREVYSLHNGLEVDDIMKLMTKNSKSYLRTLLKVILADYSGYSEEDVIRMIFGIEGKEELMDKRPFSKLKRDLLINAQIIDRETLTIK